MSDTPGTSQQPAPTGRGVDIWPLVLADIEARRAEGVRKYGTELRAHNGRDALVDAYQEALDLVVYLRQAIEEMTPRTVATYTHVDENGVRTVTKEIAKEVGI